MLAPEAGAKTAPRPKGVPKDVPFPNDTVLAVYVPDKDLRERFFVDGLGAWVDPGGALATARDAVGAQFFTTIRAVDLATDAPYGLLLDIEPDWKAAAGSLTLTMNYKVFDAGNKELLAGTQATTLNASQGGPGGGFGIGSLKLMQAVLVDVLARLEPDAAKFPPDGRIAAIDREVLVNRKDAVSTGTAFYINPAGQLLTAAHVVEGCVVLEGQRDGVKFPLTQRARSRLLDLAVVDSGKPADKLLAFRRGQELMLGEAVTNVGYPLSGILTPTPNLTRGNVSARAGLKGSAGIFQFSAPIQPGASGGPVVSDGGELLGVTVGTLNAALLVKEGILPQNVNFALESRYATRFLQQSGINFLEVEPRKDGSMQTANDAALSAVVQVSCYQ